MLTLLDTVIKAISCLNTQQKNSLKEQEIKNIRAIALAEFSQFLANAKIRLEAQLEKPSSNIRDIIQERSFAIDELIRAVFFVSQKLVFMSEHPQKLISFDQDFNQEIALLAVGGYGRAEMAPYSDIDLLFLTQKPASNDIKKVIETTLYLLWDLKLKVGQSTRAIHECLSLAKQDITVRTALLEHRFIAGNQQISNDLEKALWGKLYKKTGPEFIEAKLEERSQRHEKQGRQRYVLEPNIKEGKGGLRDLQTLYWIGKYLHRVRTSEELVSAGLLTNEEYDIFRRAEDFLWKVRCHLHHISKRPNDQLTFDLQVSVAQKMGYSDKTGRRAVEHFMQDYFRHATQVGNLTRIFLTELEARHAKPEAQRLNKSKGRKLLKEAYALKQGRIDVVDPKSFISDKLNILRVFEEGLRTGYLLHPHTMRLIAANLHNIDDYMRNNPEAAKIFLGLLLKHGNPERVLRHMNELGVLGAFIPEFSYIVAMMQFNMYHHYTVDEHTIQCVSVLAKIERDELTEELPIASAILQAGVNRRVLYVALLLHDIGKGRTEDHSILGAKLARKITPRLGLTQKEQENVEWLVRNHLLMSDTAQKRDIGEPQTIRDFAKAIKSRERLDLLTVLTVCDIRGVGPTTWNNWKAMLLRRLYYDTADALENGLETLNREKRQNEAKKALRDNLSGWSQADIKAELARHSSPYWQGLSTETHQVFAELLKNLPDNEIHMDLTPEPSRDATRAAFALVDHPGIFPRLTGSLALVGANVVDARTYTSKDGYATAVFWIQDSDGSPYNPASLERLRNMIDKTLKGKIIAQEAFKDRDRLTKREREFRFPTHITFDNEGSDIYTIIEVDTRDRPGLLYDLTRTLAQSNIYIASSVIATYGAQVVDNFYVKDMFGLKIYTKSKQESLKRKLRQAIADGAERAE